MDENIQQTTTPAAPKVEIMYATFMQRFLAVLIDAVLVGLVVGVSGIILNPIFGGEDGMFYNPLGIVLGLGYAIFMLTQYGATLGKKALGIKVVKQEVGENLNPVDAFLREVVGKCLSSFFLIGYLWMLWDPNKQTWHDKIAKSLVVKA